MEVDLLCPDARLAIELDGGQHLDNDEAYRRDRRKDVLLQENGYHVLRFLWEDVGKRLDEVLDAIIPGVKKAVENLPQLREKLNSINNNYLHVQQDILESFLNGGQLRKLSEPTLLPNGRRIPGLKLDHPRQLALMQALVRFSHIAAGGIFRTREIHADVAQALSQSTDQYKLGSLRYDLSKLRAKALVEKLPHSRSYRLTASGYQICLVFLKLFEKVYAPLTQAILQPFHQDQRLAQARTSTLDRLYRAVADALDQLVLAVGLKAA